MATTKKLLDFVQNALSQQECDQVKGGKSYVPTDSGSVGYINWDDVEIRGNFISANTGLLPNPLRKGK